MSLKSEKQTPVKDWLLDSTSIIIGWNAFGINADHPIKQSGRHAQEIGTLDL